MIAAFVEFLTKGLIWIIKSIFDMIGFFLRLLFAVFRLFMVVLPVTGIVYSFSFVALTIEIIAGDNVISSMLPIRIDSTSVKSVIVETLVGYLNVLSQYSGTLMYFILFLFMLILAVPIFFVFVAAGNFVYLGKYTVFVMLIDLAVYLVYWLFFQKTPGSLIKTRYRKYFPAAGKRLNEKSYNKWLERHHDEFENDTFGQSNRRNYKDDFYREDYYDRYDDEYEDDEYEEDYLEDQYLEADDEYLEEIYEEDDDFDTDKRGNAQNATGSAFNFFAGCTTLESANRKYKSLVKLYHPDNMDGDTSALQEINIQYNEIKKRLG